MMVKVVEMKLNKSLEYSCALLLDQSVLADETFFVKVNFECPKNVQRTTQGLERNG